MLYTTNKARKSAIDGIDRLVEKVSGSEAIARELGYIDGRNLTEALLLLKSVIESERTDK